MASSSAERPACICTKERPDEYSVADLQFIVKQEANPVKLGITACDIVASNGRLIDLWFRPQHRLELVQRFLVFSFPEVFFGNMSREFFKLKQSHCSICFTDLYSLSPERRSSSLWIFCSI